MASLYCDVCLCRASKGENVSRLTLFVNGTLIGVLMSSLCVVANAQGPAGAATAPVRAAVVAGVAGESVPTLRKKYVGNVEAINEVDCVARVSGFLTVAPDFVEGSRVSKGQLLFEIDPTPYEARVAAAKAAIRKTEAQIAYAQANYERLNELYNKQAGSKDDKESALSTLQGQQAQLESDKAQLILAEEDLSYTKISSMIDGRAGRRAYSTGSYVKPESEPLVHVVQTNPIYVRFTMSERDYMSMFSSVDNLKKTSEIELTLPNDEKYPLKGAVSFIDNTVKSTTDTIKIWATFENPNETLSPGGVVTVNLAKVDENAAVSVLPSAVMFDGKENYVYILVDSLDDESLYKEICADPRFKNEIAEVESGKVSKEEFLAKFKEERYVFEDPATGEKVDDFANGKVDEKYLMVLRRNVELGPTDDDRETVYKGVKVGDVVMMDGVNKARPFDLVRPFYRDQKSDKESTEGEAAQAKAKNVDVKSEMKTSENKKPSGAKTKEVGRRDSKKPGLALAPFRAETTGADV